MPDYQEMYYHLFNEISDIIDKMIVLQKQCEEMAMQNPELSETKIIDIKKTTRTYDN